MRSIFVPIWVSTHYLQLKIPVPYRPERVVHIEFLGESWVLRQRSNLVPGCGAWERNSLGTDVDTPLFFFKYPGSNSGMLTMPEYKFESFYSGTVHTVFFF